MPQFLFYFSPKFCFGKLRVCVVMNDEYFVQCVLPIGFDKVPIEFQCD